MSIIKYVTLQKTVAHDFRYDPRRLPWRLSSGKECQRLSEGFLEWKNGRKKGGRICYRMMKYNIGECERGKWKKEKMSSAF